MQELMYKEPDNFYQELYDICLKSGVKLILTQSLSKAPISGAARWLNENPVIQLSSRYKWNDVFWFTFFHEIGHILLHGKKDFFLEDVKYREKDIAKENEADEFAIDKTFNLYKENEFLKSGIISAKRINDFSKENKINPAVIVGRLQCRGKLKFSEMNNLRKRFELSN
ncbi:MAG: ImmA/IrrE family metallo-endopeptidase [Ignavibacteria bacterium]|nr:ImmA/IrrE family metallo-endopeptidase [Ignavibacteria bacterium]